MPFRLTEFVKRRADVAGNVALSQRVKYLVDLQEFTFGDLLALPGMGRAAARSVERVMAEFGLLFAQVETPNRSVKSFPKLEDLGVDPMTVSRWRKRLKPAD